MTTKIRTRKRRKARRPIPVDNIIVVEDLRSQIMTLSKQLISFSNKMVELMKENRSNGLLLSDNYLNEVQKSISLVGKDIENEELPSETDQKLPNLL